MLHAALAWIYAHVDLLSWVAMAERLQWAGVLMVCSAALGAAWLCSLGVRGQIVCFDLKEASVVPGDVWSSQEQYLHQQQSCVSTEGVCARRVLALQFCQHHNVVHIALANGCIHPGASGEVAAAPAIVPLLVTLVVSSCPANLQHINNSACLMVSVWSPSDLVVSLL